jgi:hypothetical protein
MMLKYVHSVFVTFVAGGGYVARLQRLALCVMDLVCRSDMIGV